MADSIVVGHLHLTVAAASTSSGATICCRDRSTVSGAAIFYRGRLQRQFAAPPCHVALKNACFPLKKKEKRVLQTMFQMF
jgi:hypothetical protein